MSTEGVYSKIKICHRLCRQFDNSAEQLYTYVHTVDAMMRQTFSFLWNKLGKKLFANFNCIALCY